MIKVAAESFRALDRYRAHAEVPNRQLEVYSLVSTVGSWLDLSFVEKLAKTQDFFCTPPVLATVDLVR
jgi:hypothetical protein